MKKLIVLFIAAVMSFAAAAADEVRSVDISKLTNAQKADVLKYAASLEESKGSNLSEKTREEVGKWGELGVGMGRAAVAAAKEVGVAANEFVQTPLGKITMGVVVYKVIGKDIIKFLVGSTVFTIFLTVAVILVFRKKGNVTYDYKPALWGLYNKKYLVSYKPDSDVMGYSFLGAAACAIIALVVGLNIIF
jgi:hypothetical protein